MRLPWVQTSSINIIATGNECYEPSIDDDAMFARNWGFGERNNKIVLELEDGFKEYAGFWFLSLKRNQNAVKMWKKALKT